MLKRRSNEDILQFIRDLPGGNVPQYAKLLSTTPVRISALLHTKEGEKLAKTDKVVAAERGQMPTWSFTDTRGALRGRDVNDIVRQKRLPEFIDNMLNKVHPQFRDDALNFLREALDQTAGHNSFEDQITSYMSQDKHNTDQIVDQALRLERADKEIARFDALMERAQTMATMLEDRTKSAAPEATAETTAPQGDAEATPAA